MKQMRVIAGVCAIAILGFTQTPAIAGQDCECIGNGKRIKEGGVICLQIGSSQRYLARCERNLNNTSWKKLSDGCPISQSVPASTPVIALTSG